MKLLQAALLVIAITMFSPTVVLADGNQLLKDCREAVTALDGGELLDPAGANFCMGLTQGVRHAMRIIQLDPELANACFPDGGINNDQGIRIVTRYLEDLPEALHENDVGLTLRAYLEAFPCE